MNGDSKTGLILLSIVLFVLYAVAVDYDSPESKRVVARNGMLILFLFGASNLFGLRSLWQFLSKRVTIVRKTDFNVFVSWLSRILTISLMLFIWIAGIAVPGWLDITFNGASVNVEFFLVLGVTIRLLIYRGT